MKAFIHSFIAISKIQLIVHIVMAALLSPLLFIGWNFLFVFLFMCGCFLASMLTVVMMSWGLGGRYEYTTDTGLRIGRIKILQENVQYFEGSNYPFGFAAAFFGLFVQVPFLIIVPFSMI